MKRTLVLLDLEGTIIDDWCSRIILTENLTFIKNELQKHKNEELDYGLFSYAVANEKEKERSLILGNSILPYICENNERLVCTISINDVIKSHKHKFPCIFMDVRDGYTEFFETYGDKRIVFLQLSVIDTEIYDNVILFDDSFAPTKIMLEDCTYQIVQV